MKKHIIAVIRNFGIIFAGFWTFLESSSGFGWITLTTFGLWGYLNMCLISLLLSFITTYIEFYYRGKDEKIKEVIERKFPEIIDFNGSYRFSNWEQLISSANKEIILCGYYFDTWLTWTEIELKNFLQKQNSKLRIIVSNPIDQRRLKEIQRLFPQYSEQLVRDKIFGTKTKVEQMLQSLHLSSTSKLDFYFYNNLFNFSYILIDSKLLYLTVYENERIEKADTFSIIIDLEKNQEIKKFILKENRLVLNSSQKI